MVQIKAIHEAYEALRGVVHETPLDFSDTFSELSGSKVYLKLENLQKTGSFKIRGSYIKMSRLSEKERKAGVVAASAGNHAQGVAYAGQLLGIPCTIVMPINAPLSKIEATKRYGATVVLQGNGFDEALAYAQKLQLETGATFIHAFDDEAIVTGQGTLGLEVIKQLPEVDAVILPIGGGGLIAGVGIAIKALKPSVQIIGVEASACPSMTESIRRKELYQVPTMATMADGIAVKRPGELTFRLIQDVVDNIVCVDEKELASTMLLLLERNKQLVEGSGASSVAALLGDKLPSLKGKNVVAVLSGGNVDVNFISRIIEYGMAEAGRYFSFATIVPDKPGQLQQLLRRVAELEANVLNVHHQRAGTNVFPGQTSIHLSLETRDRAHIQSIEESLQNEGYVLREKSESIFDD
ncbi:threonine ammonia-lyase [Aureibacillus halotolerans]|uniref:threonine ammonia-lyase n=1 Tax=Aureibacillus halotolerans TaxID=1508390 RepID=A0A4R6TVG8_9BACI|nr:threonine ammonia-lyase [Aureibacillus halotolerans]TDQ37411.1 threonine dehydratase [Aureibacillus halotolerans]